MFAIWSLQVRQLIMSALGHKRTSDATPIYVRYWGQSGHSMSAFIRRNLTCNRVIRSAAEAIREPQAHSQYSGSAYI